MSPLIARPNHFFITFFLSQELSARESLALFARFKGVEPAELDAHVAHLLSLVSLSDVADAPVMTFSGGMKRRLSVVRLIVAGAVAAVTAE